MNKLLKKSASFFGGIYLSIYLVMAINWVLHGCTPNFDWFHSHEKPTVPAHSTVTFVEAWVMMKMAGRQMASMPSFGTKAQGVVSPSRELFISHHQSISVGTYTAI